MQKIKSILFPTDLSNSSRELFKDVVRFADQLEAKIEIVHIVAPELEGMDLPVMAAQATKEKVGAARIVLQTFLDTTLESLAEELQHPADINVDVELGTPVAAILTLAERDDIDLILMGTEGAYSKWEQFFGSVTSEVVNRAKTHILAVPVSSNIHEFTKLAFATDLEASDFHTIWEVSHWFEGLAESLDIVHLQSGKDTEKPVALADLETYLNEQGLSIPAQIHSIKGEELTESLNKFAVDNSIDLLVMPSPHRGLLERLFHKSKTRKMAMYAEIPIFVYRKS
ncbi:MAG: universal stress protein [Phaeodactylibacter sp.]|nr:universal stress protein [Phaeodactylibacter sp.]